MSCKYKVLSLLDGFLCLFVFFPLALFHWRGTWGLQDVYFFPDNEELSSLFSLAIGTVGCIALQFCQPILFSYVTPRTQLLYYVVSRVYLYISGWFIMAYWRGLWDTMDFYLTEHWLNSVVILAITLVLTLVTRTSRNNVGLPFSVALDTDQELLMSDTALKVEPSKHFKYFCDVCYTQVIIVTANICVWRGIWNFYDAFLFPQDKLLSDLLSLVLGYLLCIQILLLQWPAGITSAYLDKYPIAYKIIFEDVILFGALLANLLLWRGGWDLCVAYVIPDPTLGGWISHWIGTIGLILCQTFNTVAMNGLEIDGEANNGEGIFPTSYLRLFFIEKPEPKLTEEEYLIESADSTTVGSDEEFTTYPMVNGSSRHTAPHKPHHIRMTGTANGKNNINYNSFSSAESDQESHA